jgi:Zn finger protein HypA/HybF involved in hydrogenase expression
MNELTCPNCNHAFLVEDYAAGFCPNCDEAHYYWDDGWNYETQEDDGCEGFCWE